MKKMEAFEKQPVEKKEAIVRAGLMEFSSRMYTDASTDRITDNGGISKGLLFHYFGSKKCFYIYCLSEALGKLIKPDLPSNSNTFYDIVFDSMDSKMKLCLTHPLETKLVNLSSRDASKEIAAEKTEILQVYIKKVRQQSEEILSLAISCLKLKEADISFVHNGLILYTSALINKYLLSYQEKPEEFFQQSVSIKQEFRRYIDLMLKGIEQEEES